MTKFKGSGDTPQTPSFQKISGRLGMPAKQISHQMMPSPKAVAAAPRTGYSNLTPADASGKGQIGLNILSAGKNGAGLK